MKRTYKKSCMWNELVFQRATLANSKKMERKTTESQEGKKKKRPTLIFF